MENPSCSRTTGALPTAYAFTLIQHNLVVTVLFLVNSGHMVHGSWKDHHISFMEFFPIVLGLGLWCSQLKKTNELFCITDNESILYIINKQTAKDTKLLSLLRTLNILFRARHIKGARNVLADSLSRLQVEKFKALAPGLNPEPTPLPVQLLPANWEIL